MGTSPCHSQAPLATSRLLTTVTRRYRTPRRPAADAKLSAHGSGSRTPSGEQRPFTTATVAVLVAGVLASAMIPTSLSVLSREIIEGHGLTRSAFGSLFTTIALVGAVGAPLMGIVVDRLGGRRVLIGVFLAAIVSVVALAVGPSYRWLLLAAAAGGLALGSANAATNKVVSEGPGARRGAVIGLKQAGGPLGFLVAGVGLPWLSVLVGWQGALVAFALVPALGLLGTLLVIPPARGGGKGHTRLFGVELGIPAVGWLMVIGGFVAAGGSAVQAFTPLFARETVGLSLIAAGVVAAMMGIAGAAARVIWSWQAERFERVSTPLGLLAGLGIPAVGAIWASQGLGVWLLWVGILCFGGSVIAWHAVVWVALLRHVGTARVGRASGSVHLGSAVGLGVGPLVFGRLSDASGAYGWGWAMSIGCFAVAAGVTWLWRRSDPSA